VRVPSTLLPPLVLILFLGLLAAVRGWELPTMQHQFGGNAADARSAELIVDGLRCRGTSNFFVRRLENAPGLLAVGTYVQEHRAEITFDPAKTSLKRIREIIEEPVILRDGRVVRPFSVREIRE
jgi:hypothetical protein